MVRASVIALVLALWPAHARAQEPPAQSPQTQVPAGAAFPAGARIGFVQLQAVLTKSALGQRLSAELKQLTDQRDAELKAKEQGIADLEAQLNGPVRQTLTREAANALVLALNRQRAQLNFDRETWQRRVQDSSQAMLADFREQMLPVIEAIREERGLLLVLSLPTPGVVASDPRLDLSTELIAKLDARAK